MIIERYANRTDTKAVSNKGLLTSEKRYYKHDEVLRNKQNSRMNTMRLKT